MTETDVANSASNLIAALKDATDAERTVIDEELATLRTEQEELSTKIANAEERRAALDKNLVANIKHACAQVGISLEPEQPEEPKQRKRKGGGGKRSRLSSEQMKEATAAVLKVLPTKSGNHMSVSDVAKKAHIEPPVAKSALLKLKRAKKAETNGARGKAGGWRKV